MRGVRSIGQAGVGLMIAEKAAMISKPTTADECLSDRKLF